MSIINRYIFIIILFFWNTNIYSQSIFQLNTDTINSKDLLFQFEEDTLLQTKKKKKKKKIYFGEKTKKGFINIHASLLPSWRGAAPIQRSIMNLDKETGISIIKINQKLDAGPICNSYKVEILENENTENISNKLSELKFI